MTSADLPPYARIAAELRALIDSGDLAPGDRTPSTREITQRWGVAMATASKALAQLREQGLVHAIPGVGTVVAGPPSPAGMSSVRASAPRPSGKRAPSDGTSLTRERIVGTGVAVADAEGLAALSMRRVAVELGVATMSLYRHVSDKDDLLIGMVSSVADEWEFPVAPPDGWRARVELATRELWAAFRRHPWLALALSVSRPQPMRSGLAYAEWVLEALDDIGLDLATMLTTHITLVNYVRGTALSIEQEAIAQAETGIDAEAWMATQEPAVRSLLAPGRYPVFERIESTSYDFDLDALFEFGLQRLLDGVAALIAVES